MFEILKCVKGDGNFKAGQLFPAVGTNNGVQLCYCSPNEDTAILFLHNYGEVLMDSAQENQAEFVFVGRVFGINEAVE